MTASSNNFTTTRDAFSKGYLRGREDERAQASIAIMTLKATLNKALAENHKLHLTLRETAQTTPR
jgi:hypothetical protein